MINFLHTFQPNPILLSWGWLEIHWYGFFVTLGIVAGILTAVKLAEHYGINKEKIFDLAFWLIVSGIIGARIYHIFLEFAYYLENPLDIFKIWQGGMAIHGAIIAGAVTVYVFSKKEKINFWLLTSLIVPGAALGQAIGRWGNYFNQELFGLPTDAKWGIPIDIMNRPLEFISVTYFHPTFLYESLGSLVVFTFLIGGHFLIIKNKKFSQHFYVLLTLVYIILYSILRFSLEFIRIDTTPVLGMWRWPQLVSLFAIFISFVIIFFILPKRKNGDNIE